MCSPLFYQEVYFQFFKKIINTINTTNQTSKTHCYHCVPVHPLISPTFYLPTLLNLVLYVKYIILNNFNNNPVYIVPYCVATIFTKEK